MHNRINRLKKNHPPTQLQDIIYKRTVLREEIIDSGRTEINNNAGVEILTDKSVSISRVVNANYVMDDRRISKHRTLTEKQKIDLRSSGVSILINKKKSKL